MKMQKILLLGGNGYVGSRLFDYLKSSNILVTNVDLCWFGKTHEDTIQEDYDNLSKDFLAEFSHIILLAGHSSVSMCIDKLQPCFDNNVVKFINLIEKIDDNQMLIYASSAAVYGNSNQLLDESFPVSSGINYYDYTKICNDQIANLYPKKKIVGLRFGSVSGFSRNFRSENLINAVTMSAMRLGKITVTNPHNYRSVLGMNDLCRVISEILKHDTIKNRIYNITSVNTTILEFAKRIAVMRNCEIIVSDTVTTSYGFNCSNALFEKDYEFKFQDSIEDMHLDILNNVDRIEFDIKRIPR